MTATASQARAVSPDSVAVEPVADWVARHLQSAPDPTPEQLRRVRRVLDPPLAMRSTA